MQKIIKLGSLVFIGLSSFSFSEAADICKTANDLKNFNGIINYFSCTLVKSVIPLLLTLSVVGFIWGIIQYFLNPDNEEKRKSGKSFMFWGLISLFVIVSIWSLVGVLSNTLDFGTPMIPQFSNK
jgi:uncharacterized membrane-anchored protein